MARLASVVMPGCLALVLPASVWAQSVIPTIAQPVVQPIPGKDGLTLNEALSRLGRNPRDVAALIDAGNAALTMGDVDAATGFFRRADQVSPGNPRVRAGLAGAMVRNGDPFGAIPLFDAAEKAGALDGSLAADRGLAYDLVGDNAAAQRFYRQALARQASDEVVRRLALSQAIAGDLRGAETTLAPLLARQDKAAWRTRAFALAILGQTEQAVAVSRAVLPADLAAAIAPYLRYMPRLTPAQQAAAANFGAFPLPSEIGRDDPRVALFAPAGPRRPALATAEAALVPQGEPLGRSRSRSTRTARQTSRAERARPARGEAAGALAASTASRRPGDSGRVAPPEVQPTRETGASAAALASATPPAPPVPPSVAVRAPQRVAARTSRRQPAAAIPPPAPAPTPSASLAVPPAPAPRQPAFVGPPAPPPAAAAPGPNAGLVPAPGFDLSRLPERAPQPAAAAPAAVAPASAVPPPAPAAASVPAPVLASAPVAVAAPAPPPEPQPQIIAPAAVAPAPAPQPRRASEPASPVVVTRPSLADAFAEFGRPSRDLTPAAGAVDLRVIRPSRPKPPEPAKPPPPSHPSRIWVQVATGRDKAALAFDWSRLTRKAAAVFRGRGAFTSVWGQTNRLLTGPFESEAAANAFIAQLRRADVDGPFLWTSPAGQVVDSLRGR
jgi:Flp pilus assembly protein TadD